MQILQQTPSTLALRTQPSPLRKAFIILWALLFSGIPLVMMVAWIYGLGVTQLNCQRVQPNQVRCDRTQSRLLGLMPGDVTTVDQVTAAELKTQTSLNSNGTRHVDYWVALQTLNGEVTYIEDAIGINGRKRVAGEMQAITSQLNHFLASDQTALSLQRDMRFRLGNGLFPLAFTGLFMLIGGTVVYVTFRSEELVFDNTLQQFRCDRKTLLGTQTWQCPLNEIQGVTVDVKTDRDGEPIYSLKLLPEDGKQTLIPGHKIQVETARNAICEFLKINPVSAPIVVANYPGLIQSQMDAA